MGVLDDLAKTEAKPPARVKRGSARVFARPGESKWSDPVALTPRRPGRPRGAGLAAKIREETHDGDEIVAYFLRVFRGEEFDQRLVQDAAGGCSVQAVPPSLKERTAAGCWLADRSFGKAVDVVEVRATSSDDAVMISFEQLAPADALALYNLSRAFIAPAALPAGDVVDVEHEPAKVKSEIG